MLHPIYALHSLFELGALGVVFDIFLNSKTRRTDALSFTIFVVNRKRLFIRFTFSLRNEEKDVELKKKKGISTLCLQFKPQKAAPTTEMRFWHEISLFQNVLALKWKPFKNLKYGLEEFLFSMYTYVSLCLLFFISRTQDY